VLIGCLSPCSKAQSWKLQRDSMEANFFRGDYNNVIYWGNLALSEMKSVSSFKDTIAYREILSSLIISYLRTGQKDNMIPFAIKEYEFSKKIYSGVESDYIQSIRFLGISYYINEEYDSAFIYLFKTIEILKTMGMLNPNYESILKSLAITLEKLGRYRDALPLRKEIIEISEKNHSKTHPYYAQELNSLALLYQDLKEYQNALPLLMEVLDLRRKYLGELNQDYIQSLNYLAFLYEDMGRFQEAIPLLNEALELKGKLLGKQHPDYTTSLNYLASTYNVTEDSAFYHFKNRDYDLADMWARIMAKQASIVFGVNSDEYIASIFFLADLQSIRINFSEADTLFAIFVKSSKEFYGETSKKYASALNGYGVFLQQIGKIDHSFELLNLAAKVYELNNTTLDSTYANILIGIANIYEFYGDLAEAEKLYAIAIPVILKSSGKSSVSYSTVLNNYALLLKKLGRMAEAEGYCRQALNLKKELFGENSISFAISLNNLASYHSFWGEYEIADSLLKMSLEIHDKISGKISEDYINTMASIASLYSKRKMYKEAENLQIEHLAITKQLFGENNENYILSLNNLGKFYIDLNDLDKALSYLSKAYRLSNANFSKNPDFNTTLISNIADVYINKKRFGKALPYLYEWFRLEQESITKVFLYSSEAEREMFLNTSFSILSNILNSFSIRYPLASKLSFESSITSKGLIINNFSSIVDLINNGPDESLKESYSSFLSLKSQISSEHSKLLNQRLLNLNELENELTRKEKMLVNLVEKYYPGFYANAFVSLNSIVPKIKKYSALVEINNFRFISERATDSIFYCAYILNGGDTVPRQVFLFEQRQLDSVLSGLDYADCSHTECVQNRINDFHNWTSSGRKLHELIWSKLEPELKGMKTIYFSPSGKLHKINFAAIPNSDSSCISDSYHLVQLSSTREIAMPSYKPMYVTDTASIALFGGIKYDTDTTQLKNTVLQYHDKQNQPSLLLASRGYQTDSTQRGLQWNFLPGTQREVEQIQPLYKKARSYTMLQASEEAVKNLQGRQSPDVLHLATHGFFFKEGEPKRDAEGKSIEFKFSQDPLIRSGLMMAGGNLRWKGETLPAGIEDGILTAKEVSAMNLMNTKLVVLSACETGLGDIKGSEGVFGLQRAFKMAGAKYILMSLWAVPDEATKDFMLHFYTDLKKGKDIESAFRATQTAMRKQYSEPYYWAGFVLMR
jgi:CHAT domain-containing protein